MPSPFDAKNFAIGEESSVGEVNSISKPPTLKDAILTFCDSTVSV